MKKILIYAALLIIPFIFLYQAISLKNAFGPYHIAVVYDSEYTYLMGSLNAAGFESSNLTLHPGIPVQMFGGMILRALGGSYGDLQKKVLSDPEYYLNRLNSFAMFMNTSLLILLGIITCLITNNILAGLLIQLTPLMSNSLLYAMIRFNPEPFLLFATLLLVLLIIIKTEGKTDGHWKWPLLFGSVTGFGLAVKVPYIPLIFIPFFLFRHFSTAIKYTVTMITAFMLLLLPYYDTIISSYNYLSRLATHKGLYGSGEKGIFAFDTILPNLGALFMREPIFIIVLISALFFLLAHSFSSKLRQYAANNIYFRLLVVLVAVDLICLAMVLKHFNYKYLIPGFGLSGLIVLFFYFYLKNIKMEIDSDQKAMNRVFSIFIFSILLFSFYDFPDTKSMSINRLEPINFYKKIANIYGEENLITSYGSTSKLFALKHGNWWAKNYHSEALKSVYGEKVLFYNFEQDKFMDWEGKDGFAKIIKNYDNYKLYVDPKADWSGDNFVGDIQKKYLSTHRIALKNEFPGKKGETVYSFYKM